MPDPNTMDLFRLDDHVAVITGGSKGLGLSMAQGLADAGSVTVLCSRNEEDCRAAAGQIEKDSGRKSVGIAADVTDEADVGMLFDRVVEEFGRVDVLVNSAGINLRHRIEAFPVEAFKEVVNTNLTGTWLCCRAVGRVMVDQKRGSVINVGSALSAVGLVERTAYCSSKAGILGLTRTLALEWAHAGVRCNALCPGPFLTEINRPLLSDPDKVQAVIGNTALNRWAELHEIRGAAVFLASDASSYVTGSSLFVDGGWTAQ